MLLSVALEVVACRSRGSGVETASTVSARRQQPEPAPPTSHAAPAVEGAPPSRVACLARHYGGRAVRRDGGFGLELESGAVVLDDDGRDKTFDERLASPDLKDMFTPPYGRGPVRAVTEKDFDPGRFRPEALFAGAYGATPEDVERALVPVRLVRGTVSVHRRAAPALRRVAERLAALVRDHPDWGELFEPLGGGFNPRNIAGTEQKSAHAFGIAVDLNPKLGAYWRWQSKWSNRVPEDFVRAFEDQGFIWGGRWYHFDTMHFEFRPELFDESCYKE